MAAGNVGYTDTRSFSGSLLGDIAGGIKDRIGNSMQMARQERANAAKAMNVGGRNDGVTQKEFDKEYGKGYFFKRALGSNFGGDRIARTRGYFEKNPPAGRDPTGTRESRFSAGFDYAAKEGLIKGARPLQGPKAPEYLYAYDRRYADVLGDAAKFKDDTLDKDKMKAQSSMFGGGTSKYKDTRSFGGGKDKNAIPVEDKQLTEKIASSLSGVEVQMTRLEQKMNSGDGEDGEVASLVSANSKAIVAGFTGIHAALSSFLGMMQKQTKAIKDGAEAKKDAEEKAEDKANRAAEELGAEGLDADAGNVGVSKLGGKKGGGFWGGLLGGLFDLFTGRGWMRGKPTNPRALTRLARMKGMGAVRGIGSRLIGPAAGATMLWGALEGGFPRPTARYDQVTGPNAYYNDPRMNRRPRLFAGASIPGGAGKNVIVGDTPAGTSEAVIPMSQQTFRDSAKAKMQVMKKNKDFFANMYSDGNKKFFNGPNGWAKLGENLWEAIKGLFGGGNQNPPPPRDPPPEGSLEPISLDGFSEKEISDLGRIIAAEAGDKEGQALVLNSILNRYRQIKSGKVSPSQWGITGKTKDEVTLTDIIYAANQYQPIRDGSFDKITADQGTTALSNAVEGGGLNPARIKENLVSGGMSESNATQVAVSDSFYNPSASSNTPFPGQPSVATDNGHVFMSSQYGYKPGDLSSLTPVTQTAPPPETPVSSGVSAEQRAAEMLMNTVVPGFSDSMSNLRTLNQPLDSGSNIFKMPSSGLTLPSFTNTAPTTHTAGSAKETPQSFVGLDFNSLGGWAFTPAHSSGE